MTEKEIKAHFTAVILTLGATQAQDPYFKGTIGHAPFLLKLTSAEPLNYLIKIRTNQPLDMESDWASTLDAPYADAEITTEIENGYIHLWIRKAEALTAQDIHTLLHHCAAHFADLLPISPGYCHTCQDYTSATPTHGATTIGNICEPCLDQHAKAQAEADAALNTSNPKLIPLALAAPIIGGLLWALFWFTYNWSFDALGINRLPRIILILIVGLGSYGIGWPIGLLYHKSGLTKRINSILLATITCLIAAALGEFLTIIHFAYQITQSLTAAIDIAIHSTTTLINTADIIYNAIKIGMTFLIGYAIHTTAKQKTTPLAL